MTTSSTLPSVPARGSQPAGLPGAAQTATGRLPSPPRRRRGGLAALAVLLVVSSAALAGLFAIRMDTRVPVLVAAHDLPVGHEITRSDLATVPVAAAGLRFIPADQATQVIGKYVTQEVPAGRPLDLGMVGSQSLLRPGYVAVGIPLRTGAMPASGLRSGDVVNLVRAKDGEGELLVSGAVISSVSGGSSGGFGTSDTDASATVIVKDDEDEQLSTELAAAAAAGQVVVVLVERQS